MIAARLSDGIRLKVWVMREAERLGLKPSSIYAYMHRGRYAHLQLERVNQRVVYVVGGTMSPRLEAAVAAE